MAARTGAITEYDTPSTGHDVIDPEFGRGVVVAQMKGGGLWVEFPKQGRLFYSYRRAIGEWRLFPAPASRAGLRM